MTTKKGHLALALTATVLSLIASQRAVASPSGAAASTPSAEAQEGPQSKTVDDRLFGKWVAKDVDVPQLGSAEIHFTLKRSDQVHIAAWSDIPFVGQVRNKEAPFHTEDGKLVSDAIRGGTKVKYHFTPEDNLVIQYQDGKRITFHKTNDR